MGGRRPSIPPVYKRMCEEYPAMKKKLAVLAAAIVLLAGALYVSGHFEEDGGYAQVLQDRRSQLGGQGEAGQATAADAGANSGLATTADAGTNLSQAPTTNARTNSGQATIPDAGTNLSRATTADAGTNSGQATTANGGANARSIGGASSALSQGGSSDAGADAAAQTAAKQLEEAPDFTLTDLDGHAVSLKDLRGKTVYLNFWTTWCKWCKKEMPAMKRVQASYEDEKLAIVAVDIGEDRDKVVSYIDKGGYPFQVLLDTDKKVSDLYQVTSIPVSVFVNKEGRVAYRKLGTMKEEEMRAVVESLVE